MLYALHGFLGLTSDWKGFPVSPCDIYSHGLPSSDFTLQHWSQAFNSTIKEPSILLGYSLGGRLAMHALLAAPHLWKAAVLISSHPGLKSDQERMQRQQIDANWSKLFLQEPWEPLMHAWNTNPVFGFNDLHREEKNYSRKILSDTLLHWSLANQENLSERISHLNVPLLIVAGENDIRYSAIAKNLCLLHPKSRIWIAPKVGHRVPWEAAEAFKQQLHSFLEAI